MNIRTIVKAELIAKNLSLNPNQIIKSKEEIAVPFI